LQIFKVNMQADTIGNRLKEVQEKTKRLETFGKMVELISFAPFHGAIEALQNANDISEGVMSNFLKTVLDANLPKASKKNKVVLGVSDKNLATSIKAGFPELSLESADSSEVAADLLRGLRLHSQKLLKALQPGDIERAQLGLGHSYSRAKVKFSVQKNDNHVLQAIAIVDHLEKAVNTFAMRVREWYSWHFPELVKIVSDNLAYSKLVLFIGDKKTLSDESLHDLAALVDDDEAIAKSIIAAAKISMGRDMSASDMEHVKSFAERAVKIAEARKSLQGYLSAKMNVVAPNLATLIGDTVGARLISKAGSLANLSKAAASTVQILGAEKALFRALKTKGATPKYGLLYHSSFISRAGQKNKGRISRFLANKCAMAARIDNFSEVPTTKFGEKMKQQVEERIEFYATGKPPTKNEVAMVSYFPSHSRMIWPRWGHSLMTLQQEAMDSVLANLDIPNPVPQPGTDVVMHGDDDDDTVPQPASKAKKEKKDKKDKKKEKKAKSKQVPSAAQDEDITIAQLRLAEPPSKEKKRKHENAEVDGEKKKKKKKKDKAAA